MGMPPPTTVARDASLMDTGQRQMFRVNGTGKRRINYLTEGNASIITVLSLGYAYSISYFSSCPGKFRSLMVC